MNRWNAWAVWVSTAVVLAGCGIETRGGGSETGFISCRVDGDCQEGHACSNGVCAAASLDDLSEDTTWCTSAPCPDSGLANAACETPIEISGFGEWTFEWTPSALNVITPACGNADLEQTQLPGLVVHWVPAGSDGYWYWVTSAMRGVLGQSERCGAPIDELVTHGCEVFGPQFLPGDAGAVSLQFGTLAPVETWFTIHHSDVEDGPPPERGSVTLTISATPP